MERLVDPIVTDLRFEHSDAVGSGRLWKARIIRLSATATLLESLCLQALTTPRRQRGREALVVGAATFAVAVALTIVPFILNAPLNAHAGAYALTFYLVPSALPAALSFALLCGTACALHQTICDARTMRRLLAVSLVAAFVAFAVSGWLMPAANQAFRVAFAGHPVARGMNELSLGELRALVTRTSEPMLLVGPHSFRVADAVYHARWMLACLPIVAVALGAAVAPRRTSLRVLVAIGFLVGYNAYFVEFLHQQDGGALVSGILPVWLLVWAPSLLVGLLSLSMLRLRSMIDGSVALSGCGGGVH
jgi:hypothetical protein